MYNLRRRSIINYDEELYFTKCFEKEYSNIVKKCIEPDTTNNTFEFEIETDTDNTFKPDTNNTFEIETDTDNTFETDTDNTFEINTDTDTDTDNAFEIETKINNQIYIENNTTDTEINTDNNNTIDTEIKLKFKVYVFDLDDTIYLHTVDKEYFDIYLLKLLALFERLKENNIILCIATHHKNPNSLIEELNIQDYFTHIIYEKKNVNSYTNTIQDYTSKIHMITEIIEKTNCTKEDIIFFDDNMYNINELESIGVKSILIKQKIGLLFDSYYFK